MSKSNKGRKRAIKLLGSLLLTLLLLEGGARVYLKVKFEIPLRHPGDAIYAFYPELRGIEAATITRDDGTFDILLLGGSVMKGVFSKGEIQARLEAKYGKKVRLFSLAMGGQTSLDSLLKMRRLKEKKFDLVILYQAINEVRANNCPDDVYQDDYSHYIPYPLILPMAEGDGPDFALETLGRFLWISLVQEPRGQVIPKDRLPEGWAEMGSEIKTEPAFEKNVREITEIARGQGARMLLVSFAYHIPDGYSEAKFDSDALDYAKIDTEKQARYAVELWGLPPNVRSGIDKHNAILRRIAGDSEAELLDMATTIPKEGGLFIDVCHFSKPGYDRFFAALIPQIVSSVGARVQAAGGPLAPQEPAPGELGR